MNKSTDTTTKNRAYYTNFHRGRRYGQRAAFIKGMFSEGFTVDEIKKVFNKMSSCEIIAIVRS